MNIFKSPSKMTKSELEQNYGILAYILYSIIGLCVLALFVLFLAALTSLLPFLIVIGIVLYIVLRYYRKQLGKKKYDDDFDDVIIEE